MVWSLSEAAAARFEFLEEATSTNDVLRERIAADPLGWQHGSVIVTDNQTQGKGRLGRRWLAPTGKTLAISIGVRWPHPGIAGDVTNREDSEWDVPTAAAAGWIPLIAGAAMTETVREVLERSASAVVDQVAHRELGTTAREVLDTSDEHPDARAGLSVNLKWPNDVLIAGYKVCGILCEVVPGGIIIGAGLNLTLDEHDLPTLTSTSLLLATGRAPEGDQVLADYLHRLLWRLNQFCAAAGDAGQSGIARWVSGMCGTLGTEVRVELPGGGDLFGRAERLDADGRLVVINRENGNAQVVAAGDVTHVRY
ncbi:MAG: hypothetical protein B5766_04705 [Candidatus Lumbricidophila eiseniae]|uniref:biotin--[biotin carboxyl-carrier protein] ligase n=1 Tax=Candidatus Lumbricidiphila eiseniae TaxID=1969409 RepID=A0A2A6FSV2_9MICO|nr:MAG: hypothetical protein B5766_04705 [Candidatus Lumbricidophila eiseniae]